MLRRVALERTKVSEEYVASIIRVAKIGELGTALTVTSNRSTLPANVFPTSPILVTLMMEGIRSCKLSVLTGYTRHHIPGDDILHSHRRENLKLYLGIAILALSLSWSLVTLF
jgi:hypothetical protein